MPVSVGSSTISINGVSGTGPVSTGYLGNSILYSTGTASQWGKLNTYESVGLYGPWVPLNTVYCNNSNSAVVSIPSGTYVGMYIEITDVYYTSATTVPNLYFEAKLNTGVGAINVRSRLSEDNSAFSTIRTGTSIRLFQVDNSSVYLNKGFGNLHLPNISSTSPNNTRKIFTFSGLGFYLNVPKPSYVVGSSSDVYTFLSSVTFNLANGGNFYGKFTLYGTV